jgi:hypothetical protein
MIKLKANFRLVEWDNGARSYKFITCNLRTNLKYFTTNPKQTIFDSTFETVATRFSLSASRFVYETLLYILAPNN